MEIVAKGTKRDIPVTVRISTAGEGASADIDFDCEECYRLYMESMFQGELRKRYVFAGTYVPSSDTEDINILNVCQGYFFDTLEEITVKGCRTLPYEDGVIY